MLKGLFAAACGLVFSLCAAAGDLEAVRVGLAREAKSAPLYIAVAQGYFQAEGLDVQLRFLRSDAEVAPAVASGKLDFGAASLTGPFYRYAASHGIKLLASQASDRTGFPLYAVLIAKKARDAGLRSVSDLPGKRLGMTVPGSGSRYGLARALTRFNIDPAAVKVAWLRSVAREVAALRRGEIDGAVLPYASALQALRSGDGLLRLSDFAAWQEGAVFATAQALAARPSLIDKFLRAYRRGAAEYYENFLQYDDGGDFIPGPRYLRYLDVIARQAHLAPALLAAAKTYCDRLGSLDTADIDRQIRFWQREGRLDERAASSDLVDPSIVEMR